jgi:hypothetical protein
VTTPRRAAEALKESVDIDTRQKLVSWIVKYARARDAEQQAKTEKEGMGKAFKDFLEEHPDDFLYDGETGLQAVLQERRGTPSYDLVTLHEQDPLLFQRLLKLGCLQVNHTAVKAQGAQVGGIEKFAFPAPITTALQVKETK